MPAGNSKPMVSVILPVRNAEQFVVQAIESILQQDWKDFECIVINDASTDHSSDLIRGISDSRIRILDNKRPLGVADSLNRAIEQAQGKYLVRMDADDVSLPDRFSKQISFMEQNTSVAVFGTRVRFIGAPLGTVDVRPCSPAVCRAFLSFGSPVVHPSVMIRRSVLDAHNLRYRKESSRSEDFDLWIRLSAHGEIANLKSVGLLYRVHESSVSSLYKDDMANQQKELIHSVQHSRGMSLDPSGFEMLCDVINCKMSPSAEDLKRHCELLASLALPEIEDATALRKALLIVGLRYCNSNMHLGVRAWRGFRELGLPSENSSIRVASAMLLAGCIWNTLRMRNKSL